jgi:mono/diheme cytochrome c family protein
MKHARTATIFLACLAPVACSARRAEPLAPPLRLDRVQARGEKAYAVHCDRCHPGGEGGLAPGLNNKKVPEIVKRVQVRHGLGAMPSFSEKELPPEDLDAILKYLGALRDNRPR